MVFRSSRLGHCSDLSHIASGITQYGEGLVHCCSGLEECNTDRLLMLAIHSDCLGSWVSGCLLIRNRVRSSPDQQGDMASGTLSGFRPHHCTDQTVG